jgi:hypothetical protein
MMFERLFGHLGRKGSGASHLATYNLAPASRALLANSI